MKTSDWFLLVGMVFVSRAYPPVMATVLGAIFVASGVVFGVFGK